MWFLLCFTIPQCTGKGKEPLDFYFVLRFFYRSLALLCECLWEHKCKNYCVSLKGEPMLRLGWL